LNREGHPGSPYTHLITPHCGIFFVSEGEGSRFSCLGGGEFELLIEIVNLIPAGTLEFQVLWGKSDRGGGLLKSRPEAR
jgi:hypothetical protein